MMRYRIVTLFPEIFSVTGHGLLGKAREEGKIAFDLSNPRDFATDKHRTVDDTPYGGGSGMVLMAPPFVAAMEHLDPEREAHRILLTPQGQRFDQKCALDLSERSSLLLVCGRYEGFDDRVRDHVDQEISLGDFVTLGGEVAALAIIEATARLLPGVIGNADSTEEESHRHGLLEYPHYTRPWTFRGREVPEVLRSGNHAKIERFRRKESLKRTRARRPDLLIRADLDDHDRALLSEIERDEEK